ncbi:glycosyltransferase family 4 protein [Cystobacter fuscus]
MAGETRVMRRVAHVIRKYNPAEWGGMETHVEQVARHLALLGWGAEIHAPYMTSGSSGSGHALDPTVPVKRYHVLSPYLGSASKRRALKETGSVLTVDEPLRLLLDRQLPLVHLHTAGRIGGAVRTALRLTKRPYVISIHGPLLTVQDWQQKAMAERFSGAVDLGRPFGMLVGARRVLDDAARIIVFNEEERRAMTEKYGPRVILMEQGVDLQRMESGDAQRARRRWPHLAKGPVLTVLARLTRAKNQLLAIQAFARGAPPDAHLVLAGATVEADYRASLEREIQASGLGARVHIMGNLDANQEVPDLLALSRLMMMTSHVEPFGLVVLEAWAAGCPVLMGTRFGLAILADAIGKQGLFVNSQETEDWASALRSCLASPERLDAAARAGKEVVRQRFSWTAFAQRTQDLYLDVLEENRRRAR